MTLSSPSAYCIEVPMSPAISIQRDHRERSSTKGELTIARGAMMELNLESPPYEF